MKTKEKKEKPTPVRCVCGGEAVLTVFRGKKMVSCPNPEKCSRNFRTRWNRDKDAAITEWNNEVNSFKDTYMQK